MKILFSTCSGQLILELETYSGKWLKLFPVRRDLKILLSQNPAELPKVIIHHGS